MSKNASVIVVGAGLAGLQTATLLRERGADVTVVEAADRVGGRTSSRAMGKATFNLGGQWLGPKHRRMFALVAKHGLGTFPTFNTTGARHRGPAIDVQGETPVNSPSEKRISARALPDLSIIITLFPC